MPVETISTWMWKATPLLLMVVAAGMARRGLLRRHPFFFAYLVFVALKSAAGYWLSLSNPTLYFYVYWVTDTIAVLLAFLILYEIFRKILTAGTLPLGRHGFTWIAASLLLVATGIAWAGEHPAYDPIIEAIYLLRQALRYTQVGLMGILLALTLIFGFRWDRMVFGVVCGFGLYATVELFAARLLTAVGYPVAEYYTLLTQGGYLITVAIWLSVVWSSEKVAEMGGLQPPETRGWLRLLDRMRR